MYLTQSLIITIHNCLPKWMDFMVDMFLRSNHSCFGAEMTIIDILFKTTETVFTLLSRRSQYRTLFRMTDLLHYHI